MQEEMQKLENKVELLEAEVLAMQRTLGTELEKKDPKAWERLEKIGKKIAKIRKESKPSWKIISESRR